MGQGRRHLYLCTALQEIIRAACVPENTVGFDQFVYFDAANPKRCLAPDAFATLGVRDHVERVVTDDTTPCLTLGMTMLVGPVDDYPVGLRLARDADGRELVLTEREGRRAAEQRVADLEKELASRRSP